MKQKDTEREQEVEKHWGEKYRRFSGKHMKGSYVNYAAARRDPLNKDPSWGESVLKKFSVACDAKGVSPSKIFSEMDVDGDRTVCRPELNRALSRIFPEFSENEFTAIFDFIDHDDSGSISITEFVSLLNMNKGYKDLSVQKHALRYRNPLHKINRLAPAKPEGWDHIEAPPSSCGLDQHAGQQLEKMLDRLGPNVTTRSKIQLPRYHNFSGGSELFSRREWQKARKDDDPNVIPAPTLPDPGGMTPKPGWCWSTHTTFDSAATPRAVTPRVTTPQAGTPRSSRVGTPRSVMPLRVVTPSIGTPRRPASVVASERTPSRKLTK
jgi:hypothetical protein